MKTYTPFAGWMPDADPTQAGVLTRVENMIPTVRGYRSARAERYDNASGLPYTADYTIATRGIGIGEERLIVGNGSDFYEREVSPSQVWHNVSPVGASRFISATQYGNIALVGCVNGIAAKDMTDAASAPFSMLSNVPNAFYMETVQPEFVFCTTGTPSEVRWSAIGNYLDWAPSAATQAGNSLLRSGGRIITGLKRLGSSIVVYKTTRIFVGEYVRSNEIWRFREIPADIGAVNNEAICSTGGVHYFRGENDFYMFDGTRPVSIGGSIRDYANEITAGIDPDVFGPYQWQCEYDDGNECVWFVCEKPVFSKYTAFVYNIRTQQWGVVATNGRKLFRRSGNAIPYLRNPAVTSSDIMALSNGIPLVIGHEDGSMGYQQSSITTGWIGDEYNALAFSRVLPRLPSVVNTASVLTADFYGRESWTDSPVLDAQNVALRGGSFDRRKVRKWNQVKIKAQAGMEISGINVDYASAGSQLKRSP